MESILETLYIYLSRPQAPDNLDAEKKEYLEMSGQIAEQFGTDFMDRFAALRDKLNQWNWQKEFTFGFRTCARLMLELLEL